MKPIAVVNIRAEGGRTYLKFHVVKLCLQSLISFGSEEARSVPVVTA